MMMRMRMRIDISSGDFPRFFLRVLLPWRLTGRAAR
nr:MAG TPA: hypothetical protein [Inoviridae sp.]